MERMDMYSRNQYLKVLIKRYLKVNKKEKGLLLDEYCKNTGQNRKYVIRKIRGLAFLSHHNRNELRLYKNFFQPVMKLIKKERVDGKLKRIYDVAKTPYQRLIESGQVLSQKVESLRRLYEGLNPIELKRRIDAKLDSSIFHQQSSDANA